MSSDNLTLEEVGRIPAPDVKKPFKTIAQIFFEDHQILTKRPPEMLFEEYWFLRQMQHRLLKKLFRRCPSRKLQGIIPGNIIYRTKRK